MKSSKILFLVLALMSFLILPSTSYSLPDDPPKEEEKDKKLKDKLVDKVLDELAKAAAKKLKYSRNDRFVSGSVSSHTDIGEGYNGDYDDVLVKDSTGNWTHLDGTKATADEVKAFEKKYPGHSIIPDFTAWKWNTGTSSDPTFSHRYENDLGHINVSGLQLHASFDVKAGKMTLTDQYGVTHEGLGGSASAVTSLTLININGESKTVSFDKGDFHLKTKLAFALSANTYVRGSTTDLATLNGLYSHNTMEMGVSGSARLSLPTEMTYKKVRFTVTPYVGASAYSNVGGSMDYDMAYGGASRNNWNMGSGSGASFEAGVSVSISLDDAAKMTRGLIRTLTGR